jgi:hypothetical protein
MLSYERKKRAEAPDSASAVFPVFPAGHGFQDMDTAPQKQGYPERVTPV